MFRRSFLGSLAAAPAARLVGQQRAPYESKRGVHPRLFLDAKGFVALKSAIRTTHAPLWKEVKDEADRIAAQHPPKYEERFRLNDSEQLWQRPVGSRMPYLAMAHALTGNPVYLKSAQEWALASCGYPHWGLADQDGGALSGGHQLVGMAVIYDWLYHALDPEAKETIRRTLLKRCADCYVSIPRRRKPLLQNHLWIPATGLAAATLAIFDEPEAAPNYQRWLDLVIGKYRGTEEALGPDGASHEGVGYWSYGVEYMLKYWHLAEQLLDEHPTADWWRQTAAYRLYLGLPRNAWTRNDNVVDIADSPRSGWYGPDYLLYRMAQLYKDGNAQWLAREVGSSGIANQEAKWLNLIWCDASVPAKPPSNLPTLRHFSDMEIVSARSGWSGDESMVVVKCGPPAGHDAQHRFPANPGVGHVHPDAGHIVAFGAGEWLLRDDGYVQKFSDQHNTLLVDGKGQLGEGGAWMRPEDWYPGPKEDPRILKAVSTREIDEIIADATPAYPAAAGLRRFIRRVYFLKPDALLVVDDVAAVEPRNLELRFHPEFSAAPQPDGSLLATGKKAVLRIEPLTRDSVEVSSGDAPARGMEGKASVPMFAVRLGTRASSWKNAVAFSWAPVGAEPPRVTLERFGGGTPVSTGAHDSAAGLWIFRSGGRKVYLNWDLIAG